MCKQIHQWNGDIVHEENLSLLASIFFPNRNKVEEKFLMVIDMGMNYWVRTFGVPSTDPERAHEHNGPGNIRSPGTRRE
jgi:hypothetical protein